MKHRTAIGRTREVRGPDALEMAFAGMIVSIVSVIALWFGIRLIRMAQTLDALSIVGNVKADAILHYEISGRWPSSGGQGMSDVDRKGGYVEHLALGEGGVIIAELSLSPTERISTGRGTGVWSGHHGFLTFRPELLGSKDAPSISYLCGYAQPRAGAVENVAASRTTLPRKYLPPFCR